LYLIFVWIFFAPGFFKTHLYYHENIAPSSDTILFSYTHSEEPSSFRASAPVSDGGFVFAGSFGTGDEILMVKLNKELKLN
jgi:hypothetical protein